jgi:hypothetical protein
MERFGLKRADQLMMIKTIRVYDKRRNYPQECRIPRFGRHNSDGGKHERQSLHNVPFDLESNWLW